MSYELIVDYPNRKCCCWETLRISREFCAHLIRFLWCVCRVRWLSGDYWNVDSNIMKWGKHEAGVLWLRWTHVAEICSAVSKVRRNGACANHDVHRHVEASKNHVICDVKGFRISSRRVDLLVCLVSLCLRYVSQIASCHLRTKLQNRFCRLSQVGRIQKHTLAFFYSCFLQFRWDVSAFVRRHATTTILC